MSTRRALTVFAGLALTGLCLGALAGAAIVAAVLFAIGLRHGWVAFPVTALGSVLGGLCGGAVGAVLAPFTAYAPLNRVPVGRLFAQLTVGTVLGGSAAALLLANPSAAVLGAVLGFLVAADRLAVRFPARPARATASYTDAA